MQGHSEAQFQWGSDLPPQHQHLSESGGSEKRGKHNNSHPACSPNSTFSQPLDLQLQASGSLDARFNIDRLPARGGFPKGNTIQSRFSHTHCRPWLPSNTPSAAQTKPVCATDKDIKQYHPPHQREMTVQENLRRKS